jgi:small subunit ribosomal protein S11
MATKTASKQNRRKKAKRTVAVGTLHIHATFNNTIVTMSDEQGNSLAWASSGASGFKGSRKSTPYAAQIAAEKVAASAKDMGMQRVNVEVRGIGSGRESAIRALSSAGIQVASIRDVTGVPHNGCRPRKPRRV